MEYSHLVRVNQAINAASLLIKEAAQISSVRNKVFLQSAVLQLDLALTLYARELAENYRLPNPSSINSIEQLAKRFLAAQSASSEVDEFLQMGRDKGSWYSFLLNTIKSLKDSKDPAPIAKAFSHSESIAQDENHIPLFDYDKEPEPEPDAEIDSFLFEKAVLGFKELIFRQRETSFEY